MTTPVQTEKAWDFSHVLDLINTLSPPNTNSQPKDVPMRPPMSTRVTLSEPQSLPITSPLEELNATHGGISLGDFGKIWEYLGTPVASPAPKLPTGADVSPTLQQRVPEKADYTSDGAVYGTPGKRLNKGIKWRDEANAGDLTDFAPIEESQAEKLSKKQRQKKNRRERQRLAAEGIKSISDLDSEPEGQMPHYTPAHKASAHTVASGTPSQVPRTADAPSSPTKTPKRPQVSQSQSDQASSKKSTEIRQPQKESTQSALKPTTNGSRHASVPSTTTPKTPEPKSKTVSKNQWPVSNPFGLKTSPLLPASVQPIRKTAVDTKQFDQNPFQKIQNVSETPSKGNRGNAIQPKVVRSGEDRNWALLLKIIGSFYEDRGRLISPANLTTHSNDPRGIHVFVDASNIFIGFHDQLKRARNIPQHFHVPRVNLSFDALALLMERRRPVAKRVLVGSKPHLAAFDVAEKVGYECNILDRVLKARELTERQKYFQEQEKKLRRRSSGYNQGASTGESGGSGSETSTGPVYAPEKYVEQGVDEIIHLKMMESIVDTEEPSTIVLATGDAAQAEYSQGFLKMAERALKKGWNVELVSWSKNISQLYKKAAFRSEWGERFKIIELDDFAEELLDM